MYIHLYFLNILQQYKYLIIFCVINLIFFTYKNTHAKKTPKNNNDKKDILIFKFLFNYRSETYN